MPVARHHPKLIIRVFAFVLGGLTLATAYGVMLWRAPQFLINQDVLNDAGLRPENRLIAEHNSRLIVISIGGALVVGVGLLYTARNYRLAHRGQVTERFTKALERLGSTELYVRIGGVHALEHVMRDSPEHHEDVIKVLVAFIRDRAPRVITASGAALMQTHDSRIESQWLHPVVATDTVKPPTEPAPDIQAALVALGQRPVRDKLEGLKLNLAKLHLHGAQLESTQFQYANLRGSQLQRARLGHAQLQHADLQRARLQGARLWGAQLQYADLTGAQLQGARLWHAQLQNADLTGAQLQGAILRFAQLQNADLTGAQLQGAILKGAQLQGANLANAVVSTEQLKSAEVNDSTRLPVEHR